MIEQSRHVIGTLALSVALAPSVAAQSSIPLRQLSPAAATTTEPLGLLLGTRRLSDGRLLVNDGANRRLLIFDPSLARATVVADTGGSTGLKYGATASPIVAALGDTTLFLDRASRAFIVLDGNGKQARVAALPKAGDQLWVGNSKSYIDPAGRLVYRGGGGGNPARDTGQAVFINRFADSAAVVRADFETRTVDTVGRVKLPQFQENHNHRTPGAPTKQIVILFGHSLTDDWTMLPDGTIALVRSQDYSLEWLGMDGSRTSSPKMPFAWQRLDDGERKRLADSAAKETQAFIDAQRAKPAPPPRPDGSPAPRLAGRGDLVTGSIILMDINAVAQPAPLERIPEFRQPIRVGQTLADRQGNVWILPAMSSLSRGGGLVYDVVNRKGELTDRVELPAGRSIVEFAPDGALYLAWKEGDVWRVERRSIVR
jgi:hypothetical protein